MIKLCVVLEHNVLTRRDTDDALELVQCRDQQTRSTRQCGGRRHQRSNEQEKGGAVEPGQPPPTCLHGSGVLSCNIENKLITSNNISILKANILFYLK